MSAVDNIMKRLLGTIFVLPMLFLLSCESEEKPQLGTLIIEHVTHDAISCQVKVVSGEVIDYGFYYSTTKDTAEKSGAPKEKGTYPRHCALRRRECIPRDPRCDRWGCNYPAGNP